ncbi:MAG: hydrogenase maturation protease [Candidatus Aminicenantales bacterium]
MCGVGNPGRGDDGIGPALVARLEKELRAGIEAEPGLELAVEIRFQLNVEDALTFSRFDRVVVVDASRTAKSPFEFYRLEPQTQVSFSTHALLPQAVLAWCRELYGRTPEAYILAVRGVAWELGQGLSPEAEKNLGPALDFLKKHIQGRARD